MSNSLKKLPSLEEVAARVIWWKTPSEALAYPEHLVAHAMTHGTLQDVLILEEKLGLSVFHHVLNHPPAGVFDQKSWVFWHVRLDHPLKDLPTRFS